jgi:lipoprotein NlpI
VAETPKSVVEEAREEAEQALRLQPDLPEAHRALGLYHYWGQRDYDRALQEFETARSTSPSPSTRRRFSMLSRTRRLATQRGHEKSTKRRA